MEALFTVARNRTRSRTGYPTLPHKTPGSANAVSISRFSLLGNFLPLALIAELVALSLTLADAPGARMALFIGLLYLAPPLCGRLLTWVFRKPTGRDLPQSSSDFKVWWVLLRLQMPFNRLPWLEELLRMVPGLYPLWLNLWGARVHPATFWAPGARIIDRPYVSIGYGSVIGTGALLSGHLARTEDGPYGANTRTSRMVFLSHSRGQIHCCSTHASSRPAQARRVFYKAAGIRSIDPV
jgi:hypothetical protein